MAEREPARRRAARTGLGRASTTTGAVAVGALAAGAVFSGAPAFADEYPSWGEIEQAKQNEQTKQAEIDRVTGLLTGLQAQADAAVQASQIADEASRQAAEARDAAAEREQQLAAAADAAEDQARTSRMRVGLIAAQLARNGGGELPIELLFSDAASADELLRALGTASKAGERSQHVFEQAKQDRNSAESLRGQADVATRERERLSAEAEARADASRDAADAAISAVAEQQRLSEELYAQLASLKDTTAELERERAEGQAAEAARLAAEEAARRAAAEQAARDAEQAGSAGGGSGGGGSGGGASGGGGSGGGGPAPDPGPGPGAPNGSAVETAIAFAYAQLGEPYVLNAAGPDAWDCSGLTLMAYRAAGIDLGGRGATSQYRALSANGKAVPVGSKQRGDLLFWGSPGNYYHVAIYLGGGRILEAPNETTTVREWYIWGSPSAAARPAG